MPKPTYESIEGLIKARGGSLNSELIVLIDEHLEQASNILPIDKNSEEKIEQAHELFMSFGSRSHARLASGEYIIEAFDRLRVARKLNRHLKNAKAGNFGRPQRHSAMENDLLQYINPKEGGIQRTKNSLRWDFAKLLLDRIRDAEKEGYYKVSIIPRDALDNFEEFKGKVYEPPDYERWALEPATFTRPELKKAFPLVAAEAEKIIAADKAIQAAPGTCGSCGQRLPSYTWF